ncbi:MAG: type II toxin-antitoxin system RelB/DinJ family antitoxin [Lachnospiraceae bacterium]|nr:type II toxin-antitoxin system RelB/DinJ family antitoxin [Lachnospiraceae bacterium]MCD8106059.1 type II toxin-antitoxin system RelB/DinJ family antitoxin [Lachnospiraceae bacterium]
MSKVSTSISIDSDVKAKAQALFADFGMDLSTAINIFLRQAIRENAIPFVIQREDPNADTIAAIKERDEMLSHPEKYKRYSSFREFMKEEEEADV